MIEIIQLDDIFVTVTRKPIKNVHLSVNPPEGRVALTAPLDTRLDVLRAYIISRLGWIRNKREQFLEQARETPRRFIERESHYLWGRRYLLSLIERESTPEVSLGHKQITLFVRPGSSQEKRAEIIHNWHKALLHQTVPSLITHWEAKLGVSAAGYFLQRMKTKWGSCNPQARNIRLNTELVKKPKHLLEYVIVHELIHLIQPTHNDQFISLLDTYYPDWLEARAELNELPLSAEEWRE